MINRNDNKEQIVVFTLDGGYEKSIYEYLPGARRDLRADSRFKLRRMVNENMYISRKRM